MDKPKNLLFPTDFSPASAKALPFAVQLARGFDADLHVLHVEELHDLHERLEGSPAVHDVLEALEREASPVIDHLFEQFGAELEARGVLLHRARRRGLAAAPEILDYAREHGSDLIVMATHGRRGLSRLVLGSVAEEVVRFASLPVLTVNAREEMAQGEDILVPLDLEEGSAETLAAALEVAQASGSKVEVFHVVESPLTPVLLEGFPEVPTVPLAELTAAAQKRLGLLIDAADTRDVPVTTHVVPGSVAETILQRAQAGEFGLLVQGRHRRGGLERLILGSVAQRVLTQASCPVLTLKAQVHGHVSAAS